jgi:GNAT superfamily N-acetyltransferase
VTLGFEVSFWKWVYQRKDQEPTRYVAYLAAEEELSKTFVSEEKCDLAHLFANDLYSHYQESCYYLDNLCVDFRYHRLGIGTLLLQWGLDVAHNNKLWVGTEAAPKGLGLYLKHGFKQVGWFVVAAHGIEHRAPVLRLEYSPA